MKLDAISVIARQQEGVVSLEQCLASGLSLSSVRTLVNTRRWQRIYRGVFADHTGWLSGEARIWAAVLFVGEDAVVSHITALWLAKSKREPLTLPIHLSVVADRRPVAPPDVVIHRLARKPLAIGWPGRMNAHLAVIEAAQIAGSVKEVVDIVCDAVGSRDTTPRQLIKELAARPRHTWRPLLTDMLSDVAQGAQSPLELADLRNDRAHGLPAGQRQVKQRVGGQGRWLDVVITVAGSDFVLVKELDGRLGHEGAGRFRDMDRDNVAAVRGATPVRFGWTALNGKRCQTAAFQRLVWARNGVAVGGSCSDPACWSDERVGQLEIAHPRWKVA